MREKLSHPFMYTVGVYMCWAQQYMFTVMHVYVHVHALYMYVMLLDFVWTIYYHYAMYDFIDDPLITVYYMYILVSKLVPLFEAHAYH